ncbi:MAG: flagellar biosynthesis protein FlgN [Treponema sp.]|nr:flagellar biosynthesis protein FlgN [Treponema sp.]MDY3721222.1 flagellar biosynthesis protein FlgN [Treponema sp.]MDY5757830.1 flagellar biosynthesis protein FlgN [Treponema sp.]
MAEITQEELNERVAILRRFKSLLEEQRGKFREYLTVLEKQQDSITSENPESLLAHTELEQQVVKNIANLQKVIVPMSKMYKANAGNDASIQKIQNELSDLQDKVLKQNAINRDLLKVHIEQLRAQIAGFKNPYKANRSVYANVQTQNVATMVHVEV